MSKLLAISKLQYLNPCLMILDIGCGVFDVLGLSFKG